MKFNVYFFVLALVPLVAVAQGQGSAEALFAEYQRRAADFDPAVADLYCETATIRNTRTYPDGQQRVLELPAVKYKELVRAAMPAARARGDKSKYSEVAYTQEGDNVRITAMRYSELKQYSSPLSLLVGPCNDGDWAVLEELGESRP